jgi:hypothetical protein
MKKNIISEENARAQVQTFLDYYEINLEDVKNTEAKNGLDSTIDKVVKQIMLGKIEIREEADTIIVNQHLKKPMGEIKIIEYAELGGKHKVAMKDKGANDFYGRLYAMLGSISGLGETAIVGLKGTDLSACEALGVLYLNV